jgi:beta-phosphoglucomutase
MPPNIRALIFDVDGVLADTIEPHYQSWKVLADEAEIPFTLQDYDALRGLSRRHGLERLLGGRTMDEPTMALWMERKNAHFLDALRHMSSADRLPGVTEMIEQGRAAGLKLGVASASRNARAVLDQLQLTDQFEAIADAHCVSNNKPAPDLFIWAAGRLGISPASAVVFEDAQAGVQAARTGGFWTVGIGDLRVVGAAHVVVPSLRGVTLAYILEHLPVS